MEYIQMEKLYIWIADLMYLEKKTYICEYKYEWEITVHGEKNENTIRIIDANVKIRDAMYV